MKRLVRDPFGLSISEIKKLTPYQVKHHYFCPDPYDTSKNPPKEALNTQTMS